MLSLMKMLLKREVGGPALNSDGNYIVDHENSWKYHEIMFEFLWEPCLKRFIHVLYTANEFGKALCLVDHT